MLWSAANAGINFSCGIIVIQFIDFFFFFVWMPGRVCWFHSHRIRVSWNSKVWTRIMKWLRIIILPSWEKYLEIPCHELKANVVRNPTHKQVLQIPGIECKFGVLKLTWNNNILVCVRLYHTLCRNHSGERWNWCNKWRMRKICMSICTTYVDTSLCTCDFEQKICTYDDVVRVRRYIGSTGASDNTGKPHECSTQSSTSSRNRSRHHMRKTTRTICHHLIIIIIILATKNQIENRHRLWFVCHMIYPWMYERMNAIFILNNFCHFAVSFHVVVVRKVLFAISTFLHFTTACLPACPPFCVVCNAAEYRKREFGSFSVSLFNRAACLLTRTRLYFSL